MWFKNILAYRIDPSWTIELESLGDALSRAALQPCGGLDRQTIGWVSPRDNGELVYAANGQWLIAFGVEQKLLPSSVVNQVARDRANELEVQQGYKVGRKQLRELRERITEELLPRAFPTRRTTWAWIDRASGWLVVNASSVAKAEELVETLRKTLTGFTARPLDVNLSPGSAMTDWLAAGEPPAGFTIDQDLELKAVGESRAAVRYVRHPLEGAEIREHIAGGKLATQLGLTWNDRVSFVLTEQLQVKRLQFLDVLREQAENEAESADEMFEIEFVLMTGEITRLLAELIEALGGERTRD